MTHATVQTSGPRPAVRFERQLAQPPEVVWRALTDPEELRSWFPSDIVTEEWKVGAALTFPFREHDAPGFTGTVLELDAPRLLVYTWGDDTLRFELTPNSSGGTILVLTDELAAGIAARNAAGWEVCLERLAGHAPGDNAWKPLFDHYVAAFEPALGPQQGPPPGFEDGSH
jgi:uncharacterized protein YndB with AHSA1/START domain